MVAADATVITTNTNTSTNITSGNSDVEVKDVVKDAKVKVKVKGLVKTCIGKPYSVERYYMLSEIEQNAIRPIYLNDYNDKNNQIESESDSEDSSLSLVSPYATTSTSTKHNTNTNTNTTDNNDECLYFGIVNHPRAAPGLESCLDSIMIGSKDRRRIQKRQRQRRRRLVLDSGSSNRLVDSGSSNESCGTSNGINDNLKTRSTTTGSFNNDDKSCITMVCNCLDDLIGFDEEGETDAVQNVFQSRSSSSFYSQEDFDSNENEHEHEHEHDEPPILEFAENAHQYWRVHIAGLTTTAEPTIEKEEIEIQKYNNDSYSNNNTSSIKSNTTKYVVVDDSNSDINNKLVTVMVWITVLLIGYISYYIGK
ncbi:hypothetical protein FRACYDRAFT_236335 [Fragilariopsis cylindrus CCMP1102]|uniref:Uncharacterized protein n=1 Tax=Fragilariopsis cylindrus CCMP1102 TaxID=635003 RepID=A0A1E7FQ26_9STRA|nr:hypothetical protein FRACYDRAFT_236335 [Fragilariopsis cylindrus CCMP1102]|eukprot:OEU20262.1 hypothetical protein FRACYDRAFT_236335 [Fragilariopsis cylindrus CCMP1102]